MAAVIRSAIIAGETDGRQMGGPQMGNSGSMVRSRSPNPMDCLNIDQLTSKVDGLLRMGHVCADDRPMPAFPNRGEIEHVLVPILQWCLQHPPKTTRGFVGIAAPPAAGKTVVSAWLSCTARVLSLKQFAFLSLDGYHLPNAVLDLLTGRTPDGATVPMRQLKGTPPSYDVNRLLNDLVRLKSEAATTLLPCYSRELHEPVPNSVTIGPEIEWVIIEGNFLFLNDLPWKSIWELLDRRIFLDAEDEVLRERLERRHAVAGRNAKWIEAHFQRTDGPNIRRVRESARYADVILRWNSDNQLEVAR